MVDKNTGAEVIFLCDGKACPEDKKTNCYLQSPDERPVNKMTQDLDDPCRYTGDIAHAVNFSEVMKGANLYVENMKKAMISQPMADKTDEEISAVRERAVAVLRGMGYEVVDTLFEGDFYSDEQMRERGITQIPLYFLAKSLESMSLCDTVYFCKGWENARGCKFEHAIAGAYGQNIMYDE